ncbi:ribonuclease E/G [Mycobacterium sp. ITM-2017-0098]|nr:ribonuclease E/G [Mycobacterium sp. ITM-2017-0098]
MADNENFQGPTHDITEEPQHTADTSAEAKDAPAPEKLRVHSLARVLGTTSKRIIDALVQFDGRARSAHSTVGPDEADRVRQVLAEPEPVAEESQPDAVSEPVPAPVAGAPAESPAEEEPESRLILEAPSRATVEPADYLPLFVAPQPVRFEDVDRDSDDSDDDDDTDADDTDDDVDTDSDDDQSGRPTAKRRRRGRRGRGRGRGEQNGDEPATDSDTDEADGEKPDSGDESDDSDDDSGEDDGSGGDAGSRRRRRRRRRKSGSGDDSDNGSTDDPPNTVVHEREPRKSGRGERSDKSDKDEIQGISGSTRLEAKRQRRRDGRDAGRRRPPILSEAEFLARREAVERVMVVRDKVRSEPPHEGARYTQIAVMEDGVVVEHFVTSAAQVSLVGNIYLGIVQNVLPSMEAAFVDIGRGRNGVLYAGEVNWEAAGLGGAQRKIEQALKPGDYVVVQVSKDPVGHKGARLTTQVSLAGRYLVYVPGASSTGISRKLPDTERQRLKEILREVVPSDAGVIIRTASEGVKEDDIRTDVDRLQKRWTEIEAKAADITGKKAGAAVALYEEPDVLVKVIRDLFNEDFSGLIVSGADAWQTITDYVNAVAPELLPRMTKYEPTGSDAPDVFAVHRIDEQLTKAMDRKVYLPSGGTLVIDRTEAMTVVDVNTGKFTGSGGNLEQTVTRNNLEAAEETVRQLRLRDIGGIVVIDFIDMVLESNRDLVLRRLTEALGRDRTRHQVSEVTSLGLVQLTRKKLGTGLIEAFSTTCTHCQGRGIMLHGDPVDSAGSTNGRKAAAEPGSGRRSKRGKRGAKPEQEVQVAKVPDHLPGEHPMFKAMAAANGRHEDDESDEDIDTTAQAPEAVAELDADATPAVTGELDDDFVDDTDDSDDEDDDESDEIDLDEDDEDEDEDDDIDELEDEDDDADDEDDDVDDEDDDLDDEDDDLDDDADEDDADGDDADEDDAEPVAVPAGRQRRRAAARPAGPPSGD